MEGGAGWISPGSTPLWATTGTREVTTSTPVARALNTPLRKLQRFSTLRCIKVYLSSFSNRFDLRFPRSGPDRYPDKLIGMRIPAIGISLLFEPLFGSLTSFRRWQTKSACLRSGKDPQRGFPPRDCRRSWPDNDQE